LIDLHHHLGPDPNYPTTLRSTAESLGIERTVLVGLPAFRYPWATNDHTLAALKQHPDHFLAFAYIEPAESPLDTVARLKDQGFVGLKLIRPRRPYDDPSYLPYYARAAALNMPILFHTGMVSRTAADKERDVHSARMRPVFIDFVARQVPDATLIMAHLGLPWWDEAAEACRLNHNVYVDLSGPALRILPPDRLRRTLWWDEDDDAGHHLQSTPHLGGAWRHIDFGSDVPHDQVATVFDLYRAALTALDVPSALRSDVLGGTAKRLLGLAR
jgi:predicted TIM-barrel fold metal-dependent hydrolase